MKIEKFNIQHLKFKILFAHCLLLITYSTTLFAQDAVPTPAPPQSEPILLMGATAHLGTGEVIENAAIGFENGVITFVGQGNEYPEKANWKKFDITGKHIYPGIIAPVNTLGVSEIDAVRATRDYAEVGSLNPHVRSIVAYNTDSRVTPTIRSNGILISQVTPVGGRIAGTSSIVQLDAWNWEDAIVKVDDGIHLNWPKMQIEKGWWADPAPDEHNDKYTQQVLELQKLFQEAQAYAEISEHPQKNIRYESMKGLFDSTKRLYVNTDYVREIIAAVNFVKPFNINMTIVGGRDSWMAIEILKENNVSVIYTQPHSLPYRQEDDIDLPYKTPYLLQQAGVDFCIGMAGNWDIRNLPFQAGTAAAYGLTKEQALQAITVNTAKILGIAEKVGTIEKGKQATIIVSSGDVLDMKTSTIEYAFIDGRSMDLDNKQKALYRKFRAKYE